MAASVEVPGTTEHAWKLDGWNCITSRRPEAHANDQRREEDSARTPSHHDREKCPLNYLSSGHAYDRTDSPHWVDLDGDGQGTRQEIPVRDSQVPVNFRDDGKVDTGLWECPYTGRAARGQQTEHRYRRQKRSRCGDGHRVSVSRTHSQPPSMAASGTS